MRVTRIGDHLAVEIPDDVASSLGLQEGDEVAVSRVTATPAMTREDALEHLRTTRWDFPANYKFDRDEANER